MLLVGTWPCKASAASRIEPSVSPARARVPWLAPAGVQGRRLKVSSVPLGGATADNRSKRSSCRRSRARMRARSESSWPQVIWPSSVGPARDLETSHPCSRGCCGRRSGQSSTTPGTLEAIHRDSGGHHPTLNRIGVSNMLQRLGARNDTFDRTKRPRGIISRLWRMRMRAVRDASHRTAETRGPTLRAPWLGVGRFPRLVLPWLVAVRGGFHLQHGVAWRAVGAKRRSGNCATNALPLALAPIRSKLQSLRR